MSVATAYSDQVGIQILAKAEGTGGKTLTHSHYLKPAEAIVLKGQAKISNQNTYKYYEFRYKGSIIRNIAIPVLVCTLWSILITILYVVFSWKGLGVSPSIISILSLVVGLLLVFRTNTAYDRYWEARKLWGTLALHIRNLSRFFYVVSLATSERDIKEKVGCLNLLLAFAVSLKHRLRNELGPFYEDLYPLLVHLPDFSSVESIPEIDSLPLEISFHLSQHVSKLMAEKKIDAPQNTHMIGALSGMVQCMTDLERIRTSPLPISYSIHLRQTVLLYVLTLPFQLVAPLMYVTIPVVFVASFTLLGIESIGTEIEQPFGYDYNDLRLDQFCNAMKTELTQLMERSLNIDSSRWSDPIDVKNMTEFKSDFSKDHVDKMK